MIQIEHTRISASLNALLGLDKADEPSSRAADDSSYPMPGQHWPEQGGTYAGIMRGDDGTLYHLIVGPENMDLDPLAWGGYGDDEGDAVSCWDGLANTRALLDADHKHPAAQAIGKLNIGNTFADWYLPAQAELSLCRATARHLFQQTLYWSSTQYSALLRLVPVVLQRQPAHLPQGQQVPGPCRPQINYSVIQSFGA